MITRRFVLGHGVSVSFLLPAAAAAGAPHAAALRPAVPCALPLVLLDPGHGGKDPGAIGISGTYEKHIALATAQELRRQLGRVGLLPGRADPHARRVHPAGGPCRHRPTARRRPVRVDACGRAERPFRARRQRLHPRRYRLGYPDRGAGAAENAADRFAGPAFRGAPPEVAHILASLVRQETQAGSARMARDVVSQLHRDLPLLQNPSRQAGFKVLKAADIPSVLVEMGFMSNREDEAALRQPAHRARVAAAMKRAVDAYFSRAPAGTLMARRMTG